MKIKNQRLMNKRTSSMETRMSLGRIITATLFSTVLLTMGACSQNDPRQPASGTAFVKPALETSAAKDFNPLNIHQVAVYPLRGDVTGKVNPDILEGLTVQLIEALQVGTDFDVINVTKKDATESAIESLKSKATPIKARAYELARSTGAQAVLYGVVSRYQLSDGSALGASNVASVAFQVWLLDAKSARVVWSGNFQRTEEPITDNILGIGQKLKGGIGYKSAQSLATGGFEDVAKELDRQRRVAENS